MCPSLRGGLWERRGPWDQDQLRWEGQGVHLSAHLWRRLGRCPSVCLKSGHPSGLTLTPLTQEIYKDRQKFSEQVFKVASSDLVNMGISVVSYTLKDIHDDQVLGSWACPPSRTPTPPRGRKGTCGQVHGQI